jgi:hypothetical protein
MPAQTALAPVAGAAIQINFTDYSAANQLAVIRVDYLSDELVARCSGETVVSTLQLQIGIANPRAEHPNQCESGGSVRPWDFLDSYTAGLQMN